MSTELKYKGLLGREVANMTTKESEVMIKMTMVEMERGSDPPPADKLALLDETEDFTQIAIMRKRLEAIVNASGGALKHWTEIVNPELLLTIASFEGNQDPGASVLWAYTLGAMRAESDAPMTLSSFARDHFPFGVPTKAAYSEAWAEQKDPEMPLGNYLDSMDSYQSIADAICKKEVPA